MKALKPYPPLLMMACAAVMIALRFAVPGPRAHDNLAELRAAGITLMTLAATIAGVASQSFRKHQTPVMPFLIPNRLVTTGLYSRSRNPMYLMMVLVLIGLALWLGATTPPLVIPVFIWMLTVLIIRPEEVRMEAALGEEYRAYRRKVRRWL